MRHAARWETSRRDLAAKLEQKLLRRCERSGEDPEDWRARIPDELCKQPLGAADYLAIARHYPTVLIDRVPKMTMDERTWAARFVTLIDALYEHRTKLVMSADAPPDDLYAAGDGAFEFQRTASRLHEMRSADYLAAEREAMAD